MRKNILAIGIVFLFFLSALTPVTFGLNVRTFNEELIDKSVNFDSYHISEKTIYAPYDYIEKNKDNNVIESNQIETLKEPFEPLEGPPMDSPWPMFNNDIHHTGRSPYSTAHVTGLEKWRHVNVRQGWGGVDGGPIIDKNGIIYYGDEDDCVYAIYPNGTRKWYTKLCGMIGITPAIDENGIIYVGTKYAMPNYFYAIFSENGTVKWKYKIDNHIQYCCPVIGDDGTIYFGDINYYIHALYPNGTVKWRFKTGAPVTSSPVIGDDGIIFCGSHDFYFYAIYPNNGTLKWKYKTGHFVAVGPCTDENGMVYFVSRDSYLYAAYQNNGTIKWKTDVGAGTHLNIDKNGIIYAGWDKLHAVYSENGTVKWTFKPGTDRVIQGGSPITSIDGTIYFGAQVLPDIGGFIFALNSDGTEKWRKKITEAEAFSNVESSLCIGDDGTVYIGSEQMGAGYLHAFGPVESNSPPSAPTIRSAYYDLTFGVTDTEYWYRFIAHDPDNNPIRLFVDWGDGTTTGWTKEFASSQICYFEKIWNKPDTYTIRAKVKDVMGEESDWGYFTFKAVNGKSCILMGEIKDFEPLYKYGQWRAKAKSLWVIQLSPFYIKKYTSGEQFYFYRGLSIMELDWLFGFFLIWWDQ